MAQVDTDGKHSLFLHIAARWFTYWEYKDETFNIASNEDIMENNYIFVMLWNLHDIGHLVFPLCFF